MKLLLDTQLLLWAAGEPEKLSKSARTILLDTDNSLLFSPISLWEIVIKSGLGRDDFQADAALLRRSVIDNGYEELPVTGRHAVAVASLPPIHKDPFDRMLIAQAISEGVMLLTTDATVSRYDGPIRRM